MIRFESEVAGYRITLWEEAGRSDYPSQDAALIAARPSALRLAAIDGSTPPADARGRAGLDAAAWAANVVRAVLAASPADADQALAAANSYLHQPQLRSQAQSMATVACADITARGVEIVRAGNSEAWLKEADGWRPLFGTQFQAEADAAYRQWLVANPQADAAAVSALEEQLFGDPAAWISIPVGRFPVTCFERASLGDDWQQLVLATDGARLDAERLADLDGWLDGLRDWERVQRRGYATEKRHDDVTVLRVRPAAGSGR